ncbi:hypothetical protein [Oceanobacillus sp. Castelsardo]|uniref:hypothetical protein n=1 Tax=Oceanobacillus sp. Castelsardo TaxID=1851204 RepID=UPI0012E80962|nr:hypothetical protein [Oceanobacillus sp. Castelsardo]
MLVPQNGSHSSKSILENWYVRIGYRPVRMETIEALFPDLAQMLAVPSMFVVFQKELK